MNHNHRKPVLVKIGLCSLNNDPIDFNRNLHNILATIKESKEKGCKIRVGP